MGLGLGLGPGLGFGCGVCSWKSCRYLAVLSVAPSRMSASRLKPYWMYLARGK